jgi:hypothetical protein
MTGSHLPLIAMVLALGGLGTAFRFGESLQRARRTHTV